MRPRAARLSLALAIAAAIGSHARAQVVSSPGEPVELALEETSGRTRTMREVRGRVVIVFYEDREHTDLNRALKEQLHRFVVDNGLQPQVTTYAVANVHGIDGVVRDLARTAIRAIASQYGIQILLDWEGALMRAPWSLANHDANVVLVDRQGRIRWRHTGAVGEAERTSFYRTLRQLIREPAPSTP